jgi:hypothetical protein
MERPRRRHMRRLAVIFLVLSLLLTVAAPAEAGEETFGGVLRAEWQPDELALKPGEEGTVRIILENLDNETQRVVLVFRAIEGPGGSSAEVSPYYLELAPGEVQAVKVVIQTHPAFSQEPGTSDCSIQVYWGHNLTRSGDEPWQVDDDTADGQDWIVIPVSDLPAFGWTFAVGIVAIVAVVLAVALVVWRKRRGPGPARERASKPDEPSLELSPFR